MQEQPQLRPTVCRAGQIAVLLLLNLLGLASADTSNTVVRFTTVAGQFDVQLFDTTAPRTVANFLNYVNRKAFDNTIVHRVEANFVVQGGGFNAAGVAIATDPPVSNEFTGVSNTRGTLAMARVGGQPDSATSQWFVNLADNSNPLDSTDGGFTVFGQVLGNGMSVVDAIAAIPTFNLGGVFTELPLLNYTNGAPVMTANLVLVSSISVVASAGMANVQLAVGASGGGTVSGGGLLPLGSNVTVTATPSSCWQFSNWTESGTNVSPDASYSFTLTTNRSLVANFTQLQYAVTVSPNGNGTAQLIGIPACGAYMRAIATPGTCATFVNWTENGSNVSTAANYLFTVTTNRTLVGNFSALTNTITASATPSDGGTTSGDGPAPCGTSVTVIAAPNPCYTFQNWTENGNNVSSDTSYMFTSSSNRTLVAHFTQISYTITTTPAGGGTVGGSFTTNCGATVTVNALPNPGFMFVNWTEGAAIVSPTASYTFTVTNNRSLVANFAGLTILNANPLPTATVGLAYTNVFQATGGIPAYKWSVVSGKLPAGLTLNAARGTLTGKPTAANSSNFRIAVTDTNKLSVSNDFTLAVHDVFGPLATTYNGLIIETNAPAFTNSGSIKIVLSKTGSFAANLALGGTTTTYSGQFDASGNATNTPTHTTLQVFLNLDVSGESGTITGLVSSSGFTSTLIADRVPTSNPVPAGTYNCLIQTIDTNNPAIPQGDGYATLAVSKTGLGTLAGTLADGTTVRGSVPVSQQGTWPWYGLLYANQGACLGWLTWDTNNIVVATLAWFKPPQRTGIYTNGFTTALNLVGMKFLTVAQGGRAVTGTWQLTLGDGNLPSNIVQTVFVNSAGTMTNKLTGFTLHLTPASGAFSGSFVYPASNRTIQFHGLLLQQPVEAGGGYFLSQNLSGYVELSPAP